MTSSTITDRANTTNYEVEYMKAATLLSMRYRFIPALVLPIAVSIVFSMTSAYAQAPAQLSLADILIGLRSKKVSLPDRNKILTEAVLARGITFSLTTEIESELKTTGAGQLLIDSIRKKSTMVKTSAVVTPPDSKISVTPVQDFTFFLKRGQASAEKGDLDGALVDFGKAIEMKSDSFDAFLARGMAHLNKKAFELAVTDLSKAIELNAKSAIALMGRGIAYDEKGDAARAKADYQSAIQLEANIEPAKTNLAKIVAEEERVAREAEESRKAAEAKKLAEVKKVAPEFVDLGQINISAATRMITPAYPAMALRAGIEGKVKVEVSIDDKGDVTSAKAVDGHQFLRQSAEDAARRSKFKPAMFDGTAIKSRGYIVYNFSPVNK
jgi:TonB family protein